MGFTGWNRSKEVCAMPLNTLESNHKLGSAEVQSAPSPWINKLPVVLRLPVGEDEMNIAIRWCIVNHSGRTKVDEGEGLIRAAWAQVSLFANDTVVGP